MRLAFQRGAGVVFLLLVAAGARAAQPVAARSELAGKVGALLKDRCLACHGADKARSGLRLDRRAEALKGGYSGPALVPGKSAESRLWRMVTSTSDDLPVMPPKGQRLSPAEIGLLRAWIDQGAIWPEELERAAARARKQTSRHWSFQPLARPTVPTVNSPAWIRNGIDAFILSRLDREGLTPAPEADRLTLLRRVSLDLIGLPPTPGEVAAFVGDDRPDAYARAVERLLASPHYGERWARPWLDLCHYGDTDGYLTDQLRPVAWRYRHWLIDALNRDLPFDQFTAEQLAGDLLPGATLEQKLATGFLRNTLSNREGGADLEQYRVEQVVDRMVLVGTGWLGLTVGCARCHDHKFDPLSQREYFQLFAFFNEADEVNIDAPLAGESETYQRQRPQYERKRDALIKPLAEGLAQLQSRWERRLLEAAANPGVDATWDRQWEVLGLIWGGNLGEGQLEGCQLVQLGPGRRTRDDEERLLEYFLSQGSIIDPAKFNELKLGDLAKKLAELKKELPRPTRAPTMRKAPVPRQTQMHVRGDFRVAGMKVGPGTPAVLPALPGDQHATRLDLARWLMRPENPLPARVIANRIWQEFFGKGLVQTADDFGVRGDRPSHPELLDYLAIEFRTHGWSMKALQRQIVTSATYRQSSKVRPELMARDPQNRLLARQASLRLSSDQVRDASLAVSGLLDRRIGGPSVFPPQPASVAMEGFSNSWKASTGRDRYRRGVYTYIQRLSPFAQNVTFDAPPTSVICTRRERSNTPLQALTLLNDEAFFEAAQSLAARIADGAAVTPAERIDSAFHHALGRSASEREREVLTRFFHEQKMLLAGDPSRARKIFSREIPDLDRGDAAAWTGVCSVVLNLHEFITRD